MTALPEHPTVLMFGEVNPDIVVTAVPDLTFGQREDLTGRTTMTVGSSVAITACGLARLGTPTGLVGVIGDDAFGAFMLQRLRERQVLVDRVRTVAGGRTGSSVILVRREDNNDRHILTDRGVMGELRAGDLDLRQASGVRHLHVGSWFLHTGAVADLPAALAAARKRGITISIDPNDDPAREWDSHLRKGCGTQTSSSATSPRHWASHESWAAVNRPPPMRLPSGSFPPASGGVVILKCGHRGAYALSAQATLHVAAPTVTVSRHGRGRRHPRGRVPPCTPAGPGHRRSAAARRRRRQPLHPPAGRRRRPAHGRRGERTWRQP